MDTEPSTNAISYKVVGTPFSTFTRTITLGLHYKGIPFEQISTTPHSEVARDAHPYGYLPTLIIEGPNGQSTKLSESQAIVRYLDRISPGPSLHFKPSAPDGQLEEKMWEVVSLIASFGFPTIEVGVIKPHLKALAEGTPERTILQGNYNEYSKITEFLDIIDQRTVPNAKYLFGDQLTWADFYLYPLLADLRALPEWILAVEHRFMKWVETMDELDAVKKTFAGTLADERS
ncbi:hypothetical protein EST38_g10545 [Candolleomyces aberdarensis]|uniref:Glutathione S-transferase n=1 Tax=Candolleomyces aberdarensis TaxID=2316362 RepID=A0A4Q2DA00_9AGAR|nr:hypothetical protein EST38_g10545 [Candolleomyces aberdarensis]